jgi:transposase, IS5 family
MKRISAIAGEAGAKLRDRSRSVKFSREIETGVKASCDVLKEAALQRLRRELDTMAPRVRQVMQRARARIFGGDTHVPEKLVSLFEPSTEIIRKGKASKPTEFAKMV